MVKCGKCVLCQSDKGDRMSALCSTVEHQYRFAMFFTLTYDPKYLPMCRCELEQITDDECMYKFVSTCERLNEQNKVLSFGVCDISDIDMLEKRFHLGTDTFAYCSTREMQLFIKRFRKHLNKKIKQSNETFCDFKYFMCSEYGCQKLRPHYHGLFFFNSTFLYEVFSEILHKSWQFGFVDFSLSRGGVSSYVASYINSISDVPELLTQGRFRCKHIHSTRFVEAVYNIEREKIYEADYRRIIQTGIDIGGNRFLPLSNNVSSIFFPKCFEFAQSDFSELYKSYTIARDARIYYERERQIKIESLSELASYIYLDDEDNFVTRFFKSCKTQTLNRKYGVKYDYNKQILQRLYLSNRFLQFCCNGDIFNDVLIRLRISQIQRYYYCLEMYKLKLWYDEQEQTLLHYNQKPFVLFMYDNLLSNKCRLRHDLFSSKEFHNLLYTYDVVPFPNFNVKRLNNFMYSQKYDYAQSQFLKHLKHKQQTSQINNKL